MRKNLLYRKPRAEILPSDISGRDLVRRTIYGEILQKSCQKVSSRDIIIKSGAEILHGDLLRTPWCRNLAVWYGRLVKRSLKTLSCHALAGRSCRRSLSRHACETVYWSNLTGRPCPLWNSLGKTPLAPSWDVLALRPSCGLFGRQISAAPPNLAPATQMTCRTCQKEPALCLLSNTRRSERACHARWTSTLLRAALAQRVGARQHAHPAEQVLRLPPKMPVGLSKASRLRGKSNMSSKALFTSIRLSRKRAVEACPTMH